MNATQKILETIEQRIDETVAEIATLHAARRALLTDDTPASTPPANVARPSADVEAPRRRRAKPPTAQNTVAVTEPSSNGDAAAATPPTAVASPTRAAPPRRRRRARAGTVVPAGKLEVLLAATDGLSTAELAARTGGNPEQLLTLLRELESGGKIRRSGARRATRWHWITDEERIRDRVAELERLAASSG